MQMGTYTLYDIKAFSSLILKMTRYMNKCESDSSRAFFDEVGMMSSLLEKIMVRLCAAIAQRSRELVFK